MKTFNTKCPECGKITTHVMTDEQHWNYINNYGYIQDIFSDWTPERREMLLTGICEACWNKIFNYEE